MVSTCGEPTVRVILIATWTSCWVVNSSFGRTVCWCCCCCGGVVVVVDVDETGVAVQTKQKETIYYQLLQFFKNVMYKFDVRWKQKGQKR